jgi:hypothetical protein
MNSNNNNNNNNQQQPVDSIDKMEDMAAELMELQLRRARLGIIAEMIKMFS